LKNLASPGTRGALTATRARGVAPAKPQECTAYKCLWLTTQSFEDPTLRLPERFRPDRTKVVVDIFEHPNYRAAMFWIDLSHPDAINSEVNQSLIKMLSTEHVIIEARGNKRKVLAINESGAKRMVELGHTPMVGEEWAV
jgi:predicted transcriptional regulator